MAVREACLDSPGGSGGPAACPCRIMPAAECNCRAVCVLPPCRHSFLPRAARLGYNVLCLDRWR